MQYLLTCHLDEPAWAELPEAQRNAIRQGYLALERELIASGRPVAGAGRGARPRATPPGLEYGPAALTDGAGVPGIDGCHTIECRDLEEAIAMAKRLLILPLGGTIEVRPVKAAADGPTDKP